VVNNCPKKAILTIFLQEYQEEVHKMPYFGSDN